VDRAWRVRSGLVDLRLVRRWDWRGPEPAAARLTAWELEELSRTNLLDICRACFPTDPAAGQGASTAELRERVRRGLDEGQLLLVDEAASRTLMRPGPIGNFFKKLVEKVTGSRPAAPPAAPPPPARASAPPATQSGLGSDVDGLVAKSPSAQRRLEAFQNRGGTVEWGPSGGGSYYDSSAKKIVIDGAERTQPAAAMQGLSHELGHANSPVVVDESSKDAYVNSMLADEGEATLANCEARSEITSNGGPDIGVAGQHGQQYQDIYAAHPLPSQRAEARQAIGASFGSGEVTSTTGQSYSAYYGNAYDQAHPPAAAGGSH